MTKVHKRSQQRRLSASHTYSSASTSRFLLLRLETSEEASEKGIVAQGKAPIIPSQGPRQACLHTICEVALLRRNVAPALCDIVAQLLKPLAVPAKVRGVLKLVPRLLERLARLRGNVWKGSSALHERQRVRGGCMGPHRQCAPLLPDVQCRQTPRSAPLACPRPR